MRTYPLQGRIDLNAVLTMGQTFAWKKRGEWHVGSIGGQVVRVKTENGGATLIADAPDDRPRRYFDAEGDMQALRREIALRCPDAARAAAQFPQIRMLRQPLWECLAGFLLSSVNNIKRIARIVENLSQSLGGEQTVGGQKSAPSPPPKRSPKRLLRAYTPLEPAFAPEDSKPPQGRRGTASWTPSRFGAPRWRRRVKRSWDCAGSDRRLRTACCCMR